MSETELFVNLAGQLVRGMLREAIGYRVEDEIPYYQGIVGYMVEAPLLWIRYSRFPILVVAYDPRRADVLTSIVKQLEIAKATEHFAILIVAPATESTGSEAEEIRHLVANSVYRYDFVVLDYHHLASIIARGTAERLVEIILEQGIELSSLSPYVVRGPVSEKMFFGRELEIKTIAKGIQELDYAVLGGRRIGKSSILLKLTRLLNNDPRCHALYLNCEDKFHHDDFVESLIREGNQPAGKDGLPSFREVAGALKAANGNSRLVFLFDEMDELLAGDEALGSRLLKTFRALSHEQVCRFVISGSRTLHQQLHDPQSPLFNFCKDMPLRPLEEKSVAEIVTRPMRQLGIELDEEESIIDFIIQTTSAHPNIVQWLCDRLIRTMPVRRLTLADVRAASSDSEFRHEYVATAWGDANDLEKLISIVMDGPGFSLADVIRTLAAYGIKDAGRIIAALDILRLYSLLDSDGRLYRFRLVEFPAMVRGLEDLPSLTEALVARIEP